MPRTPPNPRIPLPRTWPRRVRSAVIHAVAMARLALAVARARAERNGDARLCLQVENDRLRQEVALLIEEIRIKDARMSRLPAQRRPHYPPIERLAILALRAARGWSAAETARRLLVTPQSTSNWNGEGVAVAAVITSISRKQIVDSECQVIDVLVGRGRCIGLIPLAADF